jgi:hypothetical protein
VVEVAGSNRLAMARVLVMLRHWGQSGTAALLLANSGLDIAELHRMTVSDHARSLAKHGGVSDDRTGQGRWQS